MRKIIALFALILMVSCEAIEDRDTIGNSFDAEIAVEVVQLAPGSNSVTLNMNTPGVTGYWIIPSGEVFSNQAKFVHPVAATFTCSFVSTTAYFEDGDVSKPKFFQKDVEVTVDTFDHDIGSYSIIANATGKTWVFDGTPTGTVDYYYSCDDDILKWDSPWWHAGIEGAEPSDFAGKMVFDLAGAANYTYYSAEGADPIKSIFKFNADNTKLTIVGDVSEVSVLGGISGIAKHEASFTPNVYDVIELTDDRMVLWCQHKDTEGWVWIFKSVPTV